MITINVGVQPSIARVVLHDVSFVYDRANFIFTIKALRSLAATNVEAYGSILGIKEAKDFVELMISKVEMAMSKCVPLEFESSTLTQDQLELVLAVCFFQLNVRFNKRDYSKACHYVD